jgi:hypothetical protein
MSCNSYRIPSISVDSIYKLTSADHLFIQQINDGVFDERQYFNSDCNYAFIIKIANASSLFEKICKKEEHQESWTMRYGAFVRGWFELFNKNKQSVFVFEENKDACNFDLFRGAFFHTCYMAAAAKEKQGQRTVFTNFSPMEISFLKEAIKFKSIHALNRYSQYLFRNNLKTQEKGLLLLEHINICSTMINPHGSYAYMMLADAYYQYAQWCLQNNGTVQQINTAIDDALESCEFATSHLLDSFASINNASLGWGLRTSNSEGASPDEFMVCINALQENTIGYRP